VGRQWLATYVATARNDKGQRLAKLRLERYLLPRLGHFLIGRLTSEDLRRYRLWLEHGGHLSAQTVAHVLSDCRCLLGWAEDTGYVNRSPVPRRLLPRIQERPPDRLTDAEAELLRAMPEPYGFVARLGLSTGLRWGELARAQSTDAEHGLLVVHQTKTGRVRRVPLHPALQAELRRRVGKLIPYAVSASGAFARMAKHLTGIERFHPHQMRHTFACQWLERGGSLVALQQILGHSTIVTTQRYARLTDEVVTAEVLRLAQGRGDGG
jgi:integrase